MTTLHRIALLGFSAFERSTLASYFRLAGTRNPRYEQVQMLPEADFVVADADHEPSVKLVVAVERLPETVFVGTSAPEGAIAWLARPIDPLRVLRELDLLAARRMSQPPPARTEDPAEATRRRTVIQPVRPPRPEPPAELLAPAPETLDLELPDLAGSAAAAPAAAAAPVPAVFARPHRIPPPPAPSAPLELPIIGMALAPRADAASAVAATAAASAPVLSPAAPMPAAPVPAVPMPAALTPAARTSVEPVMPPEPRPARAAAAASMPARAARAGALRPVPRAPAPLPPSTALLVDDSEVALRFLQKKLAPYGLVTDCATHSEAAIKRLAERRYDFVFLDMELGECSALDGLSLCQRIKRDTAEANVVMITAHHTELDRVRGALAGCDGFLGKPLDEDELGLYLARFGVRRAVNAGAVPS
jgi:CheY-like chemotaxis protein